METQAVTGFAGELAEVGVDGSDMHRDAGMLDWAWIEVRRHQIDAVVPAFVIELRPVLPAVPGGAESANVVAQTRSGRSPWDGEAALIVALHLSAEAEQKSSA